MGAPVSLPGKRNRAIADSAQNSEESRGNEEAHCRVGALHLASVEDKELAKEHARRRNPDLKVGRDAVHAYTAEGVGAVTPTRLAEE